MASAKQNMAIQVYMENYGTENQISVGEAMRRVGYSDASAKNPKFLTDSDDWKSAMDKYLPDVELLARHRQQLDAKKVEHVVYPLGLPHERIKELLEDAGCTLRHYETSVNGIHVWFWAPDFGARAKALDLAYKLKGKMTKKVEHSGKVDGLFGSDALTITVVEASPDAQHPTGA